MSVPPTDHRPPRRSRVRRPGQQRIAGATTVLLTAAMLVSGCGGPRNFPGSADEATPAPQIAAATTPAPARDVPETTSTSPRATTPGEPGADDPAMGKGRTLGGVTWTPLAVYAGSVRASVRGGFLAIAVPSGDGRTAELRVAPNGGVPEPADGAGPLPSWAQPHVGSDARGRIVVTYPRCGDPDQVGTCDVYTWTASTGRATRLRGTASARLAETEGVMDHGNALVVREKRPGFTAQEFVQETPPLTTLLYLPAGEPVRVLTRHGGRDIDLRGGRAVAVATLAANAADADGAPCGTRAVRVLDLDGLTVAENQVVCGARSQRPVGPTLTGTSVRFAVSATDGEREAFQYDLTNGTAQSTRITQPFDTWVLDGGTSGYATRTVTGQSTCTSGGGADTARRCRLSQFSGLVWKPTSPRWDVGVGDEPVRQ